METLQVLCQEFNPRTLHMFPPSALCNCWTRSIMLIISTPASIFSHLRQRILSVQPAGTATFEILSPSDIVQMERTIFFFFACCAKSLTPTQRVVGKSSSFLRTSNRRSLNCSSTLSHSIYLTPRPRCDLISPKQLGLFRIFFLQTKPYSNTVLFIHFKFHAWLI